MIWWAVFKLTVSTVSTSMSVKLSIRETIFVILVAKLEHTEWCQVTEGSIVLKTPANWNSKSQILHVHNYEHLAGELSGQNLHQEKVCLQHPRPEERSLICAPEILEIEL